jgi:hypothetical protein
MTGEQLRNFHSAQPFKPFVIHLADGRSIEVRHPEMLAYAFPARSFAVWTRDSYSVIDLLLVTELKQRNGVGRARSRAGK